MRTGRMSIQPRSTHFFQPGPMSQPLSTAFVSNQVRYVFQVQPISFPSSYYGPSYHFVVPIPIIPMIFPNRRRYISNQMRSALTISMLLTNPSSRLKPRFQPASMIRKNLGCGRGRSTFMSGLESHLNLPTAVRASQRNCAKNLIEAITC